MYIIAVNLCSSTGKRTRLQGVGLVTKFFFFFACVVYFTVDYNVCVFGIEMNCFYIDVSFFCFVFIDKILPRAQKLFSE